jgi:sulfite exporter TauE/SafE
MSKRAAKPDAGLVAVFIAIGATLTSLGTALDNSHQALAGTAVITAGAALMFTALGLVLSSRPGRRSSTVHGRWLGRGSSRSRRPSAAP